MLCGDRRDRLSRAYVGFNFLGGPYPIGGHWRRTKDSRPGFFRFLAFCGGGFSFFFSFHSLLIGTLGGARDEGGFRFSCNYGQRGSCPLSRIFFLLNFISLGRYTSTSYIQQLQVNIVHSTYKRGSEVCLRLGAQFYPAAACRESLIGYDVFCLR